MDRGNMAVSFPRRSLMARQDVTCNPAGYADAEGIGTFGSASAS